MNGPGAGRPARDAERRHRAVGRPGQAAGGTLLFQYAFVPRVRENTTASTTVGTSTAAA